MIAFDEAYYLAQNPDVAAAIEAGTLGSALEHFELYGWSEGRDPNPLFDTSYYLEQNPDIAEAGINPLDHFNSFGDSENRNPNPFFDAAYYLEQNPDVATAGVNPFEHFLNYGAGESRNPSASFDIQFYLEQYPDVDANNFNPLLHYLQYGAAEGRVPSSSFGEPSEPNDGPNPGGGGGSAPVGNTITLAAGVSEVDVGTHVNANNPATNLDDTIIGTFANADLSTINAGGGIDTLIITEDASGPVWLDDASSSSTALDMALSGVEKVVFQNTAGIINLNNDHNGESIEVQGSDGALNVTTKAAGQTIEVKNTSGANASDITLSSHTGLSVTTGAADDIVRNLSMSDASVSTGGGDDTIYVTAKSAETATINGGAGSQDKLVIEGGTGHAFTNVSGIEQLVIKEDSTGIRIVALFDGLTSLETENATGTNAIDVTGTASQWTALTETNFADTGAAQTITLTEAGSIDLSDTDHNLTNLGGGILLSAGDDILTLESDNTDRVDKAGGVIDGKGGTDKLIVDDALVNEFDLDAVRNIETIELNGSDQKLTIADATTGLGETTTIDASDLTGEFTFDGSNEKDGHLTLIGSDHADTITGGDGNDTINGSNGADTLDGGAGKDTFVYTNSNQSTQADPDTINGFVSGTDKLDLSNFDGSTSINDALIFASQFLGNYADTAAANAALGTGATAEALFVQDINALVVDSNNNGTIDAADFNVILSGVASITAADIGLTGNTITLAAGVSNVGVGGTPANADNPATEFGDAIFGTFSDANKSVIDAGDGFDILTITNVTNGLVRLDNAFSSFALNMALTDVEKVVFQNTTGLIQLFDNHNGEDIEVQGAAGSLAAYTTKNDQTIIVEGTNSTITLSDNTGLSVTFGDGLDKALDVQTADATVKTGDGNDRIYVIAEAAETATFDGGAGDRDELVLEGDITRNTEYAFTNVSGIEEISIAGDASHTRTVDLFDGLKRVDTSGSGELILRGTASQWTALTETEFAATGAAQTIVLTAAGSVDLSDLDLTNLGSGGAGGILLSAGDDTLTLDAGDIIAVTAAGGLIDGNGGSDTLIIKDALGAANALDAVRDIDTIQLGGDAQSLTLANATTASGETITIDASGLTRGLTFDGSNETDGRLNLISSNLADTFTLGGQADIVRVPAVEYNATAFSADTITEFTVGSTGDAISIAIDDVDRFTTSLSFSTIHGDGASSDITAVAQGSLSVLDVSANAVIDDGTEFHVISFTDTAATSFATAIGSGTVDVNNGANLTTDTAVLVTYFNSGGGEAVVGYVSDVSTGTSAVLLDSGDTVNVIATVAMTAQHYANFADNSLLFA